MTSTAVSTSFPILGANNFDNAGWRKVSDGASVKVMQKE